MRMPKPISIAIAVLLVASVIGFYIMAKQQGNNNKPPPVPPQKTAEEVRAEQEDLAEKIVKHYHRNPDAIVERMLEAWEKDNILPKEKAIALEWMFPNICSCTAKAKLDRLLSLGYKYSLPPSATSLRGTDPAVTKTHVDISKDVRQLLRSYFREYEEQITYRYVRSLVTGNTGERAWRKEILGMVFYEHQLEKKNRLKRFLGIKSP